VPKRRYGTRVNKRLRRAAVIAERDRALQHTGPVEVERVTPAQAADLIRDLRGRQR
jgi:hypothetical protein